MPARARPINWSYFTGPASEGIRMELEGKQSLANAIFGAGRSIGAGIARGKENAESRRRFDLQHGLDERRMSLAEGEVEERAREQQANESSLLDAAERLSQMAVMEGASTGTVTPQTGASLGEVTVALGGPELATKRLESRSPGGIAPAPPVPFLPPAPEHLPDPLVGERGVRYAPSAQTFGEAEALKARLVAMRREIDAMRAKADSRGLYGSGVRAAATKALGAAESAYISLAAKHGSLVRQAEQAKKLEDAAAKKIEDQLARDVAEARALDDSNERLRALGAMPTEVEMAPGTLFGTPVRREVPPTSAAAADELVQAARKRKEKPAEESPEAKGEEEARKEIAKAEALRKAGVTPPADRTESDRAYRADEAKLRQALDAAKDRVSDAEKERAGILAVNDTKEPISAEKRQKYEQAVADARKARDEAADKLQKHLRGGALDDEIAAIENDPNLSPEEKIKRLEALSARK